MRICLDISAALGQGAGIGRYARELALALHHLQAGPELILFHNRQPLTRLPPQLADLPRFEVPWSNKIWRLMILAGWKLPLIWLKSLPSFDIFHGTDVIAPPIPQPIVITIHDLTPLLYPQHHTFLNRWYIQLALPRMIKRATRIITDAYHTKSDIITHLNMEADKIQVVYLAVDHTRFYPRSQSEARQRLKAKLGLDFPYILALGTLEPRKNLAMLLRAYADLQGDKPRLILSGVTGWKSGPVFELIQELALEKEIYFTGYIADEILPDLYAGAELFIYPSLYEGFGLPVLEAMACGVPVITSDCSSLPEVAGNAAWLIDPTRGDTITEAMARLLAESSLRETLQKKGPLQASRFQWRQTAQETRSVYEQII